MNNAAVAADTAGVSAPQQAAGSSFYTAMRILPRAQRDAMFEIYSFCRCVDDVADSDKPRPQRLAELARWRFDIDTLYLGRAPEGLEGLAQTIRQYSLHKEDFLEIIAGMEMDAIEDIHAPDWAKLDLYCDRVASAVGRLSVRVFGLAEDDGIQLAHHLGRALQLTNILRDVDEDAAINRLYLPREALQSAGITSTEPELVVASPALAEACAPVIARAREHFSSAEAIMTRCSRSAVRAPRVMGAVYRTMLDGMIKRGWSPPRQRVRIGKVRLIGIVLRNTLI